MLLKSLHDHAPFTSQSVFLMFSVYFLHIISEQQRRQHVFKGGAHYLCVERSTGGKPRRLQFLFKDNKYVSQTL